jgi:hypothetical protein
MKPVVHLKTKSELKRIAAENAHFLKDLVSRSNALQEQERRLTESLYAVRQQIYALESECPHPIEHVSFTDFVPAGPDVRGHCDICYAMRHVSNYSKADRMEVVFELDGGKIAGDKLVTQRMRRG